MKSKQILLLIFLISLYYSSNSQISFEKIFETPYSNQTIAGAVQDNDGNYVVAFEEDDIFYLFKTDSFGNHLWTKSFEYGMTSGFYGQSICADDNRYFVGGYILGMGTGSRDGSILITDYNGVTQSTTKIDDGLHSNAIHSASSMDEGFILAGRSEGGNGGQYDFSMMKLNPGGFIEWARTYGGTGWDWAKWAEPTSDMGYIITGYGDGFAGPYDDVYIVKTDDAGVKLWSKAIDSGIAETGNYIREDSNQNYIIAGYTLGMDSTNTDNKGFVSKLDNTGNLLWTVIIRDIWDIYGMVLSDDNGVVIIGDANNHPQGFGGYDIFMMKIDSTGTEEFSRLFGGTGMEYPSSVEKTSDGGFLICGASTSFGSSGSGHIYLLKTDEYGFTDCNDRIISADYANANPTIYSPVDTSDVGYEQVDFIPIQDTLSLIVFDPCCPEQVYASFSFENDITDTIYTYIFANQSIGAGVYSWDFGDGSSSIDINPTYTYADTGMFTVCLTIGGICDTSVSCQDIYISLPDTSSSSINYARKEGFSIYPQPASDFIYIDYQKNSDFEVRIVNAEGRIVYRKFYSGESSEYKLEVDKLQSGIYYILLRNDREIFQQKLLILRQ